MKLEVKTGIKVEIHNKDTAMGYHYREDDWNIEAVAPSYEEAIERIIPEYVKSGIWPDYTYITDVKYVTYNNKQHIIDNTDKEPLIYKNKNIITDIKEHPLFVRLFKEKQRKDLARKAQEIKERQKKKEIEERKLLERLQKKYY